MGSRAPTRVTLRRRRASRYHLFAVIKKTLVKLNPLGLSLGHLVEHHHLFRRPPWMKKIDRKISLFSGPKTGIHPKPNVTVLIIAKVLPELC